MGTTASKKPLSKNSVNVIHLRQDFAFTVTVLNGGCLRETHIGVSLTISSAGQPVSVQGEIDQIDPGEEKTVVIGRLPLPDLDKELVLTVEVEPIPDEAKIENNSAEYPVRFAPL